MKLNERIVRWREGSGFTQAKLADIIGVRSAAVAQWETGATSPTVKHLEEIAEACGVTLSRFMGAAPKRKARAS